MNWFPIGVMAQFSAFIIYIILIVIVMSRNPNGTSNRFASLLFFTFAFWSFCEMFLYNTATPPGLAAFFEKLEIPAISAFSVILFWLFVSLTGKKQLYASTPLKIVSIALPVFFMIVYWAGLLREPPVLTEYGWRSDWSEKTIFPVLYNIYYIGWVIAAISYYAANIKKTDSENSKKQAIVLFSSTFLTLAAGTYIEVITPAFHIDNGVLNYFNNIYLLIWAIGIFIVFFKFHFLALTPNSAAESIISAMNEALVILDDEINISYVNKTLLNMLGYRENELKGQPFHRLIHDKTIINPFLKEVITNRRFKNQDFNLMHKNGNSVPCFFSASLIMEAGEMRGMVCVATDITEQKQVQSDLVDSYEKLKEIDTLKSNFTSMVSHELRTPITSIKGFLAFLLGGVGGPVTSQQREFLETIKNNTNRLLTLINDLLDTSKMESGSFSIVKEPCDLIKIVDNSIRDVHSISEKKMIKVNKITADTSYIIRADEYRVSQALINLINNSIKFSPEESSIDIIIEKEFIKNISIPAHVSKKDLTTGRYAVIRVKDSGPGLTADNLTKIFDRFYQVENINTRTAQGTGLGLNIVRNIVNLHGGAVWAESQGIGHGASFVIILPES